jgi:hypothetical protein
MGVIGSEQMGQSMLQGHETASNIHGVHQIESIKRSPGDIRKPHCTGIVDEYVYAAEFVGSLVNGFCNLIFVSNIAYQWQRTPPLRDDLCSRSMDRPRQGAVRCIRLCGDCYICTILCSATRDSKADTPRRSRDEQRPASQRPSHHRDFRAASIAHSVFGKLSTQLVSRAAWVSV